jgi:hypothetical protein
MAKIICWSMTCIPGKNYNSQYIPSVKARIPEYRKNGGAPHEHGGGVGQDAA